MTRPYTASALITAICLLASCSSDLHRTAVPGPGPSIRVSIADPAATAVIGLQKGAVIETESTRYILSDSGALYCSVNERGHLVARTGKTELDCGQGVRCIPRDAEGAFILGRTRYPDTLLVTTDGARLFLVNIVALERYLRGVVPNEIGYDRDPAEIEAVKAQAILARTYAMRKAELPIARLFDLHADTRDQVYTGLSRSSVETDRAVRETAGLALSYESKYAECYYHGTCGGSTEAVSLVWGRPQSKPYLAGIRDAGRHGTYCSSSPQFRWTESYSRDDIENILRANLGAAHDSLERGGPDRTLHLLDLAILHRMPSGRVARLKAVFGNRARQWPVELEGDRMRWVLRRPDGFSPLRSTLFDLAIERDQNRWITRVTIRGGGNGHGIGFCQTGALDRAKKGYTCEEILRAYFPGTTVVASSP